MFAGILAPFLCELHEVHGLTCVSPAWTRGPCELTPSGQSCPCSTGGQSPLCTGVLWPLPATHRGVPIPASATPWRHNLELASEPGSSPETREW